MIWTPHITVATVVPRDDTFLLVEEWADEQLVLNQPAGHLDPDETLVKAAARETLEETGWKVSIEYIIGIYLYHAPNGITYHRTCFMASPVSRSSRQLDVGIERAVWMTRAEIITEIHRTRSPLVLTCIDDYLANKRFPLSILN